MRSEEIYGTMGISSETSDKLHVMFWDFDTRNPVNLLQIRSNVRDVINRFKLSDVYFFDTRNGIHALCLDKVDLDEACSIYRQLPYADKDHIRIGYENNKYWILRLGADIKYKELVKGNGYRQKSNAHRHFFSMFYNMGIERDILFDDNWKVFLEGWDYEKKRQ